METCKKCGTMCGALFLVFGLLFLLRDLGFWMFWNVQWWTVGFLLFGLGGLAKGSCKACCDVQKKK